MPITSTPRTVSETYSDYWMPQLQITAPDPNGKVRASIVLKPYTEDEYGSKTYVAAEPIRLNINDLFGAAEGDAELATCIGTLLATVERIAKSRGLI